MEEKLQELEACMFVTFELANTLVVWNFGAACRSVEFMPEINRYDIGWWIFDVGYLGLLFFWCFGSLS